MKTTENKETFKIKNKKDQLDFCLNMNCLGCNLNKSNYKDCPHFPAKKEFRDKQK